jgi:Uma2 family endonuclease
MPTIVSVTTAEQLFAANLPHSELVEGELVMMSPAGFDHGRIASRIVAALENFVRPRGLGVVTTAEAGFQVARNPDTVRAPDAAFVRADRVPSGGAKGFFQGAPDLAVEVVSPSDRDADIAAKVQEWLRAGCAIVWVVDPECRLVTVHRSRNEAVVLTELDAVSGGSLLPDFSLPVAEIFA